MAHSVPRETDPAEPDRLLFELARELVATLDADGTVRTASPHWPTAGHVCHARDLVAAGDRPAFDSALAEAVATGRPSRRSAHLAATGLHATWTFAATGDGRVYLSAAPHDPDAFAGHAISERAGVGLTLLDPDGRYRYVNDAYCRIYGYTREELLGRVFTMISREPAVAMENHRAVIEGRAAEGYRQLKVRRKDGTPLLIDISSRRIELPGGELLRLATVVDVTAVRSNEQRLAEAEAQLRDITDALPGAIYQLRRSRDGTYDTAYVSEGLREISGLPADVTLADFDRIISLLPPADAQRAIALAEASARSLQPYEQEFPLDGPGGRRWIEARAQPHRLEDGTVIWNGLMMDVTERRDAERRLADAEARQRAVTGALPGAIYQFVHGIDGQHHFTYMSEGLKRLGDLPDDYPLTDFGAFVELVPEVERPELLAAIERSERDLEPLHQEFRLLTPAGTLWIEARSLPTRNADGSVTCNGLLVDVTQRHEARSEADRLNAILESTPDLVAITDTEGRIRYINAGGQRMLAAEEPVEGRSFVDFVGDADAAARVHEAMTQAAQSGTWEGEITLVTAKGDRLPVSQTILCHRDAHGHVGHFSTIARDLSERVEAERELMRSEERFRVLYNRTPIMLHSIDPQGRLTAVSEYWLEHLGYREEEVIGRPSTDFLTPESRRYAREEVLPAFMERGWCKDVPYQVVRADGRVLDVLLSANAERDADGLVQRSLAVMVDVTEQRRAESSYQDIFDNATEGIYRSSPDGGLLRANAALARMHGFDTEQELLDAISDVAAEWYVDPQTRVRITETLERRDRVINFEAEIYRRATGERIWASENVRAVRDGNGTLLYYEGTVRDITAQYKARQLATRRGEILEMIARDEPLTGVLYEIVGLVEQHSERLTAAIFRLQEGRLYAAAAPGLSNACISAVDGASPSDTGSALGAALHAEHHASDTRLDGTDAGSRAFVDAVRASRYGAVLAVPIRDQRGAALGVLAAFMQYAREQDDDIVQLLHELGQIASIAIEQYRLSQALLRQAQYDPLTELPNRALMADRLEQALRDADRGGHSVGVLLLDLDEFKLVNDTLGHSAGDHLLQKVAERLRTCLRAGDTVARLGGDEFVIVVPLRGQADATDVAERVLSRLQTSVRVAEREVTARPSIGIGLYPRDGGTAEALLQAADTAMYAAKHAGKNRFRYFAEDMNEKMSERLRLESELRRAIDHSELVLHYQPRIALADERIVGAEALLRWEHPERGLVGPGEFLPVAERGPLIGEIDRLVLRLAARQLATWQRAGHALVLSANLSTRELHAEDFGAEVARIIEQEGADPGGLELEITESMVMQDFERVTRQLLDLKERAPGLRVAIDDFGSGYSSLTYLRHLPIDTLKIDRSFVVDLLEEADTAKHGGAIAKTITELGRNLDLTVVAEGVEHSSQAAALRAFGCDEAQGFWYAPALPLEQFVRRLE